MNLTIGLKDMRLYRHTNENGVTVWIDWHLGEIIDKVDHSVFYAATGFDAEQKEYSGTAEYCCGEFEGIEDIELIS
jgi:hypothetical protein